MRIFWRTLQRELQYIIHSPRTLVVLVGTPIAIMLLLGYVYQAHSVNHIPTVILDYNHTSLSRLVINAFDSSDKFAVLGTVDTEQEMQKFIEEGKALAAVVIPPDFHRDIKRQKTAPVMLVVNGSNMVISNSVVTSASEIVTTLSVGTSVKVLEGKGILPDSAMNTANLISLRPRIWYNPTFNYSNFLLLGLLGAAVQQVILLYTSVSIASEKNGGVVAELAKSLKEITCYVFGKLTPYMVVNLITLNLTLFMLVRGFDIPFRGDWLTLGLLELSFVSGVAALGVFLSIISKNDLEATQTAMLIAVPSFLISGYTWPLLSMPQPVQIVSNLLPLTHFVNALRDVAIMGVGFSTVANDIMALTALAVLFIPLSIIALRWHVHRLNRRTTSDQAQMNISG